ncbi:MULTISPECIES: hypothetical protein [unclassified Legionella]|uniref:hypothetical protein n=1 Tax=unclassified Legionella TaxID=2622702 RepID=UPI0010552C18|nr:MULTISPECIES: hypothetical protein [unclassified Legionella]MDI9818396.1 hypothetical protein [Legionella sp. PL877]
MAKYIFLCLLMIVTPYLRAFPLLTLPVAAAVTIFFYRQHYRQLDEKTLFKKREDIPAVMDNLNLSTTGMIMEYLSPRELKEAEAITARLPTGSEKHSKLKRLTEQYLDLNQRLSVFNKEGASYCENNELIPYTEITDPVLLFKAYPGKQHWKAVPASTKITDRKDLANLFRNFTNHPLTREDYDEPLPYKQQPTCFLWHKYKGYSFELQYLADQIKKQVKETPSGQPQQGRRI